MEETNHPLVIIRFTFGGNTKVIIVIIFIFTLVIEFIINLPRRALLSLLGLLSFLQINIIDNDVFIIIMLVIVVDVVVTRFMNIGFIIIGADIKRSIKIMCTRFVFVSNNIVTKITIIGLPPNTNVIVIAVFINIIIVGCC